MLEEIEAAQAWSQPAQRLSADSQRPAAQQPAFRRAHVLQEEQPDAAAPSAVEPLPSSA